MSSGISEENAARSRCCGEGTGVRGSSGAAGTACESEGWGAERSASSAAGSGVAASGSGSGLACSGGFSSRTSRSSTPSSSVFRKSAASGPSRMLARLPLAIPQDLLGELPI